MAQGFPRRRPGTTLTGSNTIASIRGVGGNTLAYFAAARAFFGNVESAPVAAPPPPPAGGGTVVRTYFVENYANPIVINLTAFSSGNSLLVFVKSIPSEVPTSITDDGSSGGTYTQDNIDNGYDTSQRLTAWSRHNITDSPSQVNVNLASAGFLAVFVVEVNGLLLPTYIDSIADVHVENSAAADAPFTTNYDGSLAVAHISPADGVTLTGVDGWNVYSQEGGYNHILFKEDVGTAGAKTSDATFSTNRLYGQVVIAYRTNPGTAEPEDQDEATDLTDSASATILRAVGTAVDSATAAATQSSNKTTNDSRAEADTLAASQTGTVATLSTQIESDFISEESDHTLVTGSQGEEAIDATDAQSSTTYAVGAGAETADLTDATTQALDASGNAEEAADAGEVATGAKRTSGASGEANSIAEQSEWSAVGVSAIEEAADAAASQSATKSMLSSQQETVTAAAVESAVIATLQAISEAEAADDIWFALLGAESLASESADVTDSTSRLAYMAGSAQEATDATDAAAATQRTSAGVAESDDLTDEIEELGGITFADTEEAADATDAQSSAGTINAEYAASTSTSADVSAAASLYTDIAEFAGSLEAVNAIAVYVAGIVQALSAVDAAAGGSLRDGAIEHAQALVDSYVTARVAYAAYDDTPSLAEVTSSLALVLGYAAEQGVSSAAISALFGSVSDVAETTEVLDLVFVSGRVTEAQFCYIGTDAYFEEVEPAIIDTWMSVPDPGFACEVTAALSSPDTVVYVPSHDDNSGVDDSTQFDKL